MISFQYFYNTVLNATNGGNMEAQSKAMNEIQFRDCLLYTSDAADE